MLSWLRLILRRIRCRSGGCPGYVVSGTHDGWVWIGYRCHDCGQVKYYEPSMKLPQRLYAKWED